MSRNSAEAKGRRCMTTGEERQAERLRLTPMLVTAVAVLAASIGVFAVNYTVQHSLVVWGWIPAMLGAAVAGWACWRAAVAPGLEGVTRRLWRSHAFICVLVVFG